MELVGKNSDLLEVDVIWICTTSIVQVEILKLLQLVGFPGLLLIEKPFANNTDQYNILLQAKVALPGLSISNPWTYSEMWSNFKNKIGQKSNALIIEVIRQGPVIRNFLSPQQDWLFHDLMLSLDLARHISAESDFILALDFLDNHKQSISGRISSDIQIKISGGYALERVEKWVVLHETIQTTLNFDLNETCYINAKSEDLNHNVVRHRDHPLSTMLLSLIYRNQSELEYARSLKTLLILK